MTRRSRFVPAAVVGLLAWIVLSAATAAAHDPIFLAEEQTTPEVGPYFPDGTVSWAIYGTMAEAGETRGFEFDIADGEQLVLGLLIPNLEPETLLEVDQLPTLRLEFPDGSTQEIEPELGSVFNEPFSGTSYVRLHSSNEPAMAGRHRAIVTSRAPSRVTVAVGDREVFGTPVERAVGREESLTQPGVQLQAWYDTPPGKASPQANVVDGDDTETAADRSAGSVTSAPATAADGSSGADVVAGQEESADDPVDAYLRGPAEPSTTDRLLFPMALLAAALVIASLAKVLRSRIRPA